VLLNLLKVKDSWPVFWYRQHLFQSGELRLMPLYEQMTSADERGVLHRFPVHWGSKQKVFVFQSASGACSSVDI
jgi:hypothetical protein